MVLRNTNNKCLGLAAPYGAEECTAFPACDEGDNTQKWYLYPEDVEPPQQHSVHPYLSIKTQKRCLPEIKQRKDSKVSYSLQSF